MQRLLLTISIVCLLLVSYTAVNGAEWIRYGADSSGNERYYDKEGITHGGKGIVKVWDKVVYSELGRFNLITRYQKKV